MNRIDANRMNLSTQIVRQAIKSFWSIALREHPSEISAYLHPTQEAAWQLIGVRVADPTEKAMPLFHPVTMGGFPLVADDSFPKDKIEFRRDGEVLAEIVNLSVSEQVS